MGNKAANAAKEAPFTLDDLSRLSETRTEFVVLDEERDIKVEVRELNGFERFTVADMEYDNRWTVIRWIAARGMVNPACASPDDLDGLQPDWIAKIANAVARLSGISGHGDIEKKSEGSTDTGSE